jgi:hypothetical protein
METCLEKREASQEMLEAKMEACPERMEANQEKIDAITAHYKWAMLVLTAP